VTTGTHGTAKRRPGGRTARTRSAVMAAARDLVLEGPWPEVSMQDIARRAGVNEATLYRRWGTKSALLTELVLDVSAVDLPIPDTGSLREDLVGVVGAVAAYLRTPIGEAFAQLSAAAHDPASAEARDAFWFDRFNKAKVVFDRAVERGEIPTDVDPILAYDALIGPLHFRLVTRRRPLEEGIAERLVDLVLDGVTSRAD